MGGKSSKYARKSISSGSGGYGYNPGYPPASPYAPQPGYGAQPPQYAPSPAPSSSSYGFGDHGPPSKKRLERKFSRIADNYRSLEEVTAALAQAGLESSNLIVGIDFTKSNEWTGAKSFNRRSLHHIGNGLNPYEQAISIIGKTLSAFDEDNLIPCYGFGDASTHDQDVFSFYSDERYCNGFEEVLARYREIVPQLRLAGPTSFAPMVEMAMTIVEESGGQYHVLLIIADGQVTRSVDTQPGHLSPQEQKTIDAIVRASAYPLSIVLVGVGDGPWDMMREFDDNIPARTFDNFQFVNFTEIMSKSVNESRKQTEFALSALMEIPSQYKATLELGLLGGRTGHAPGRVPLPTPMYGNNSSAKTSRSGSFQHRTEPPVPEYGAGHGATSSNYGYNNMNPPPPPAPSSTYDNQVELQKVGISQGVSVEPGVLLATTSLSSGTGYGLSPSNPPQPMLFACPVCLTNRKDMAFGCGHQTCCECGEDLESCPICRREIQAKIRLF